MSEVLVSIISDQLLDRRLPLPLLVLVVLGGPWIGLFLHLGADEDVVRDRISGLLGEARRFLFQVS